MKKLNNSSFFSISAKVFLSLIFFSATALAQMPTTGEPESIKTDFSDDAIAKYVEVLEKVRPIQQKAEKDAIQIIEANDLTLQRFNLILAVQQGQSEAEISAEEMAAFNSAAQEIMKENMKVQEEVLVILKDHDMAPEKYRDMLLAYERDDEFRKKVDAFVLEERN